MSLKEELVKDRVTLERAIGLLTTALNDSKDRDSKELKEAWGLIFAYANAGYALRTELKVKEYQDKADNSKN